MTYLLIGDYIMPDFGTSSPISPIQALASQPARWHKRRGKPRGGDAGLRHRTALRGGGLRRRRGRTRATRGAGRRRRGRHRPAAVSWRIAPGTRRFEGAAARVARKLLPRAVR